MDLVVSEGKVREIEEKDEHKSQKSIYLFIFILFKYNFFV